MSLKKILGYNAEMSLDGMHINSLHGYLERFSGHQLSKVITLSANNTTESENIFQITGTCHIKRLWAEITDATTLTNLTAASWDLFTTGGAAVQITAATGVLSGLLAGSVISKTGLAANAFDINDNSAAAIIEQTYEGSDVFNAFLLTQKSETDTFIRFTYSTTDAPINAQLTVYVEYKSLDGGTLTVV